MMLFYTRIFVRNNLVTIFEDVKIAELVELSTKESEPHRRMPHKIENMLIKRFQEIIDKVDI